MRGRTCVVIALLAVVGVGAADVLAGHQSARIVRKGHVAPGGVSEYRVHDTPQHLYLVQRSVTESAAVVSRALSEQPVHKHLVEVRVVNTTIYLDPDVNYIRQGQYRIDDDHFILKALRLHASLTAKPARVIRHPQAGDMTEPVSIEPRLIIYKGDLPERRVKPAPARPKPDKPIDRVVRAD
ncbi:MAG: hypothetical protein V3U29_08045 [Phycisphaeraceae bacterium]